MTDAERAEARERAEHAGYFVWLFNQPAQHALYWQDNARIAAIFARDAGHWGRIALGQDKDEP